VDPLGVPQLETEQVTVQLTPFVIASLVTVAVNVCVLPSRTVELAGETATVIGGLLFPQLVAKKAATRAKNQRQVVETDLRTEAKNWAM
jgi:hypothetical protein